MIKSVFMAIGATIAWFVATIWQRAGYDYYMIHEKFETKRGNK